MAANDKLEIIAPSGAITFYELQDAKGLTNIGRHPENDVVLSSPNVAPFHAVIDHREQPFRFILLGQDGSTFVDGEPVRSNQVKELSSWNTIQLDGYSIILVRSEQPAQSSAAPDLEVPAQAEGSPALPLDELVSSDQTIVQRLETQPADLLDDLIQISLAERQSRTDAAQAVLLELEVSNGARFPATFVVSLLGLDKSWVDVTPPMINLLAGQSATLQIELTPPRVPGSTAGPHYFAVVVTSPEMRGRQSQLGGTLIVNAFDEYAVSELSPRRLKLPWYRRKGKFRFSISNYGNSESSYHLNASDDFSQCQFEFQLPKSEQRFARRAEITIPAGETYTVSVHVSPYLRKLVSLRRRIYPHAVTVSPLSGQHVPRSVVGQVYALSLIGPGLIFLVALLALFGVTFLATPRIQEFEADNPLIESGQLATLRWQAAPFARLRLEPDIGVVEGPDGSIQVSPYYDTIYTLTADNILSWIYPAYFRDTRMTAVYVDGVLPGIEFFSDTETIMNGESVTLWWVVTNADRLMLSVNGAPEVIPEQFHTGSRVVTPDQATTYALIAHNRYSPDEGIQANKTIVVSAPEATQPAQALIERFDVEPVVLAPGEDVTLTWVVSGVSKVTIAPLGEFAPSGTTTDAPDQTTVYVLRASNGTQDLTLVRRVVVEQSSTATPEPGAPVIVSFTTSSEEVAANSPAADNVLLQWSVQGPTTNVELSGDNLGRVSGLDNNGTWLLSVDESSFVTLTASNGALSTSASVEVRVISPLATISSISPNFSTDVGGAGISLNVSGNGFVPGSSVRWNGTDRATTYSSATQLSAVIPASDFATAGIANVAVFNPAPGGGTSNVSTFTIQYPSPSVSTLSPASGLQGSNDISVAVFGNNFVSGATVHWNGADRATTYVSATQLIAIIPASDLTSTGTFTISVSNPSPGGGQSNGTTFVVSALPPTPSNTPTATATQATPSPTPSNTPDPSNTPTPIPSPEP